MEVTSQCTPSTKEYMKNEIPVPDHSGSKLTITVCGAGRSMLGGGRSMDMGIGTSVSHRQEHDLLSVVGVCAPQVQCQKRKRHTGLDETVENGQFALYKTNLN